MKNIEDCMSELPTFPATSMKLIGLLNQKDPAIDEITSIIRYDSSVMSQVLKISNSAYFGMVEKVKSVEEALMTIGTSRLLQIVMAYQISGLFADYNEKFHQTYGVTSDVIWQSSVRLAVASSLVGNYLESYDTGNLFTSGLLHNIGKAVIAEVYASRGEDIQCYVTERSITHAKAEKMLLGINYQDASAMLVAKWGLAESISTNILHYNNRDFEGEPTTEMDVLFIAYLISDFADEDANWISNSQVLNKYQLSMNDLSRLQTTLNTEMKKIITMLKA